MLSLPNIPTCYEAIPKPEREKYETSAYYALKAKYPNMDEDMLRLYADNTLTSEMKPTFDDEYFGSHGYTLKNKPPADYSKAELSKCIPAVKSYADSIHRGCTQGLMLHGKSGRGKTYSACAIIRSLAGHFTVGFATDSEIYEKVKSTFNDRQASEQQIIDSLVNPVVLVIDDIGKANYKEWFFPIMFEVINRRFDRAKPTIITTQYPYDELYSLFTRSKDEQSAEAIISRIGTYQVIELTGEDRR